MLYTIAVILLVLWLLGLVSGYTIGAFIHVLLVVAIVLFLIGMLTAGRGSDRGNLLAITAGLIATVVAGKLHITILNGVAPWLGWYATFRQPAWIPEVAFTWWAMIGAVVVVAVGVCFRTPDPVRAEVARHERAAQVAEAMPLDMRGPAGVS